MYESRPLARAPAPSEPFDQSGEARPVAKRGRVARRGEPIRRGEVRRENPSGPSSTPRIVVCWAAERRVEVSTGDPSEKGPSPIALARTAGFTRAEIAEELGLTPSPDRLRWHSDPARPALTRGREPRRRRNRAGIAGAVVV